MSLLMQTFQEENSPYKKALVALGKARSDVVVLGADLANSTEIDGFKENFPERFFNVGAAEQNMIDSAVGLAFEGEIPFVHSFGVFLTRRPYEQVCVQVALHSANVKLIGVIPGITSRLGPTHQAVDDLGLMRMLPNMTVIDPADATEISQLVPEIASHPGPVYARMIRREVPVLFDPEKYSFKIGKGVLIKEGKDAGLISTGLMLKHTIEAARILSEKDVDTAILHMPTLKPIDIEAILSLAENVKLIVTIENHWINGGLGTIVAEHLSENMPKKIIRIGLGDEFAAPGTPDYLFDRFKLSAPHIADKILTGWKSLSG